MIEEVGDEDTLQTANVALLPSLQRKRRETANGEDDVNRPTCQCRRPHLPVVATSQRNGVR